MNPSILTTPQPSSPRRSRRAELCLPLQVHRARRSLPGHTLNISRSGLLFEVAQPLRSQEFCTLSFDSPMLDDIELSGRVLRQVRLEDHAHVYAMRLHGHEPAQQLVWEDWLLSIFETQHIPGALHLSPSIDMLQTIHHNLVHREPLWVPLGRPAPLHTAFSVILHHPSSPTRFDLPVIASANQHGCTLLTLASSASPMLPHELMFFIESSRPQLHS